MVSESDYPKVLSADEIDLYLSGDRRQVDRLILTSLNRISSTLIEHTQREEPIWGGVEAIGGIEAVKERSAFIDSLIERNKTRTAAWGKIAQSTTVWALVACVAFIAKALWQSVKGHIQQ